MATETLQRLAELVGGPGYKALCCFCGGQPLYVPKTVPVDGGLVELLGERIVARLVSEFGGDTVHVPLPDAAAARRAEAKKLADQNYTSVEIAKRLGVDRSTVWKMLKRDA